MKHFAQFSLSFLLFSLLTACGPDSVAPEIPSDGATTSEKRTGSSDAGATAGGETPTTSAGATPGTTNGTPPVTTPPATSGTNAMVNINGQFDATVEHRLAALPPSVQGNVKACEAAGNHYDLGALTCTTIPLAKIKCIINDEMKASLDPTTVAPLETYLTTRVVNHRLYGCTEEGPNLTLHFYLFQEGIVNYKKLNITKKVVAAGP